VDQFGQAHSAERGVLIAGGAQDSLNQLFRRLAATFRRDDHAGVED
jgi:hypothetical protein